jgi:hypothetical protein
MWSVNWKKLNLQVYLAVLLCIHRATGFIRAIKAIQSLQTLGGGNGGTTSFFFALNHNSESFN